MDYGFTSITTTSCFQIFGLLFCVTYFMQYKLSSVLHSTGVNSFPVLLCLLFTKKDMAVTVSKFM